MFEGHTCAVANNERWMERRDGFFVATIPKVFGYIVFKDAVAIDGNRGVLWDAGETVVIAIGQ